MADKKTKVIVEFDKKFMDLFERYVISTEKSDKADTEYKDGLIEIFKPVISKLERMADESYAHMSNHPITPAD